MNISNIFLKVLKEEGLKIAGLSTMLLVMVSGIFVVVEPLLTKAATQNVVVTLNVTTGITLSVDSNTQTMSTALGVAQNTAVATSTFTAVTNDPNGYTLSLAASTNPALKSGSNSIPDYSTTTAPSTWSVGANTAAFGFSVIATNAVNGTSYWGTGSFCNGSGTSTISTTLKYTGFSLTGTTTTKLTGTTTPSGDSTVVCYAAAQGTNYFIPAGTYTATITGTATAL